MATKRTIVAKLASKAVAYGMLLFLPACGIPHLRTAESGPELPSNFPTGFNEDKSSENSSQLGINEFFNDPALTGLIDQALVGNQELKILAQEIQIASNEVLARRGAYLPFVGIGAGASADKPGEFTRGGAVDSQLDIRPGQPFPTPLPNFLAATTISWQIDIWRMLRNARDAASLRYLGTLEGRNYVVTRLIAEVAENYYSLMALDQRLENLDKIIALQEKSLETAQALKNAARGTELAVQRFQAEVQKNQSERLIIKQEIVVVENRINFLLGRFPTHVERDSSKFFDVNMHALRVGMPSQLLQNRPDIRQVERELSAAGLDIRVARARFYPAVAITAGVGYEAFDTRYLFSTPDSLAYNVAGSLVAPLINKKAIQADYMTANAHQLQTIYNYQRTVLNAFTEVVNRLAMVENYRQSIEIKQQQLKSLEASVDAASNLFQNARIEYIDVLFAQRDLNEARMILIDTKKEQLSAIVNTYQALGGGGSLAMFNPKVAESTHEEEVKPADESESQLAPGGDAKADAHAPATDAPAAETKPKEETGESAPENGAPQKSAP
ncbi:MAG: TolC family protein [Planctomycetota bacterium]